MPKYKVRWSVHPQGLPYIVIAIHRDDILVAADYGNSIRNAFQAVKTRMYNLALPFREGADRDWLRKYNEKYCINARSQHDR